MGGYEFVHGEIHTKKWIESRRKFVNYASRTFGIDVKASLKHRKLTVVSTNKPVAPKKSELRGPSGLSELQKKLRVETYLLEQAFYDEIAAETQISLTNLYTVLWLQCDPVMQKKILKDPKIEEIHAARSTIRLLAIIETICEKQTKKSTAKDSSTTTLGHQRPKLGHQRPKPLKLRFR